MSICNTDSFISQLQTKIDSIVSDNFPWCQVSAGEVNHAVAIKTDGTLWTWGYGCFGRLGDGTTIGRCSPGTIAGGGTTWCQASAGFAHVAAIKTDGTLWTWGRNDKGDLGDGTTVCRCSPGTVAGGGTTWRQVESIEQHTAAIKTDGTLWTWGCNAQGQLGDGTTVTRCSPGTVAGEGTTWCGVSGGPFHTAAIKTDGTLWTWGSNLQGRLGDGTTVSRCSPGTIAGEGTTWRQVSAGGGTTAAIKTDGTLWTWGTGSLGDGTTVDRCSPGTISGGGTNWCQVSSQNFHTAIKIDGTLWTWGGNLSGQLGDGTIVSRCSPGTVAGEGTTWCQVSGGRFLTSAIKTDGTLWTWGSNDGGVLGNGTQVSRCSPGSVAIQSPASAEDFLMYASAVAQVTDNRQVSVASSSELPDIYDNSIPNGQTVFVEDRLVPVISNNECWLGLDGRVLRCDAPTRTLFTWGSNAQGRLGDGTTVSRCSPGTVAGGGTTWCQVSGGGYGNGAIKTDGTLWTWGSGAQGRLGDGTTVSRCSPGTVAGGGTTWYKFNNGNNFNIAIKTDGTLWTWGQGTSGQLGSGFVGDRCSPGTVAGGGTTWCKIFAGQTVTAAAIKTDGTLWTWGSNGGMLGDGTIVSRCSPGTVAGGGTTWCDVSGGRYAILAIKTDGTLWTWGCGVCGQLGDGTTVNRCSPGTVAGGGTTWCSVSGNRCSSHAIKTDGTLWTWGANNQGILGDGTVVNRCSPGTVAGGGTTWCCVAGDQSSVISIKTDGTLWTWGSNSVGQLGDGTTVSRCSPGTIFGGGTNWSIINDGNGINHAIQVQ